MVGDGGGRKPREGILLVDDDRVLLDLLAFLVEQVGYVPLIATNPTDALAQCEQHDPIAAVVDLNLDPHDGFALITALRECKPALPMIVLTGRADEQDKVRALDLGADDYIVKPFGHREFLARLRAHARRSLRERGVANPRRYDEVGTLRLNNDDHSLHVGEEVFHLTGTEFRLLQFLMRHGEGVVPMATVAKQVWGYDDPPARDAVRVTVHRLRRKLGEDGARQHFIQTVPGVGLRLEPGEEREPASS